MTLATKRSLPLRWSVWSTSARYGIVSLAFFASSSPAESHRPPQQFCALVSTALSQYAHRARTLSKAREK